MTTIRRRGLSKSHPGADQPPLTSRRHIHAISSPLLYQEAMDMSVLFSMRMPLRQLALAGMAWLSLSVQAAELRLQINGSNTIGAELAPQLVQGMLDDLGASDVRAAINQDTREHRFTAL